MIKRFFAAMLLLLGAVPAFGQGVPISGLPAATVPLSGTEIVPLVQGGTTKQAPVSAFSSGYVNINGYNGCAVNSPAVDCAPAFRAAVASGNYVYVPPGNYYFKSVQLSPPCCDHLNPAVLVSGQSGFKISGYGATINIDASIANSSAFFFNQDTNFSVEGLTVNPSQSGLSGSQQNHGIALASDVGFVFRDIAFTSTLYGSAYAGDWLVNGVIINTQIAAGSCFDMAFLRHITIANVVAAANGNDPSGTCLDIVNDTANSATNNTGISYTETDGVEITGVDASGYATAALISTGKHIVFDSYRLHDNPGSGSAGGLGVLVTYNASGSYSSVGVPPNDITFNGGIVANNGASVAGNGIAVNASAIANSDVIAGISVNNTIFDNNANTGLYLTGTAVADISMGAGNQFFGASQTTAVSSGFLAAALAPTASLQFSGSLASPAILGGSIVIGGPITSPSLSTGSGAIYESSTLGIVIQGDGSGNDVTFADSSAGATCGIAHGTAKLSCSAFNATNSGVPANGIYLPGTNTLGFSTNSTERGDFDSSGNFNVLSGAYEIGGTSVLNATTLGSAVVTSSLTSLGTITVGLWHGSTVGTAYGGSGVASPTAHSLMVAEGASAFNLLGAATGGRLLLDQGSGVDPAYEVMSGDATLAANGAVTVTKTNGTAFGALATVVPGTGVATLLANAATGSGSPVGATSPTLTTPNLGTPSAVTLTNGTGLPISSGVSGLGTGVATLLSGASTGTGGPVGSTSPSLTTPTLGVASATSINKVTITAPATGATLTIANGKTLTDTSGVGASILLGATGGGFAAYAGATCGGTNFITALSAAGSATCGPTPTRAGDIYYYNGTNWTTLAGNNSGTQFLQETSLGVPSWAAVSGSGTVTSATIAGAGGATTSGTCTITTSGTCVVYAPGGSLNRFRNGTFSVWQRGTSALATSSGGAYTADGWMVAQAGAQGTCAQDSGDNGTLYSLKCVGITSNTDTTFAQRIESSVAAPLAGQTVTVQIAFKQDTGSSVTPKISTCYASVTDNFATCTSDLALTSVSACASGSWCIESYTLSVSASATQGYQVKLDCNTALSSSQHCWITAADIRVTPGVSTGVNSNPPPPELRTVSAELQQCERYFYSSYGNGNTPGTTSVGLAGTVSLFGVWFNSTYAAYGMGVPFPVPMRVAPATISYWDAANHSSKATSWLATSSATSGTEADNVGLSGSFVFSQNGFFYKVAYADATAEGAGLVILFTVSAEL